MALKLNDVMDWLAFDSTKEEKIFVRNYLNKKLKEIKQKEDRRLGLTEAP